LKADPVLKKEILFTERDRFARAEVGICTPSCQKARSQAMVYRRTRRTVVEDRNPMGPIIAVLAVVILLILAWMFFSNNDSGRDGGTETGTTTEESPEQPEGNIELPGVDEGDEPAGESPAAGDEPAVDAPAVDVDPPGGS
jgi:hypothetical protein